MPKRFTDTNKWNKVWFRKLSPVHKCFWYYLTDSCNHGGIWDVDFETAQYYIGEELDLELIKSVFAKQIIELDGGKRWFLIDFIEFQYNCDLNSLNPSNKVHQSVIQILKKYDIHSPLEGANEELHSSLKGDKDKDKNMDKGKEIELKKEKFINDVNSHKNGHDQDLVQQFINYWTELDKSNKKMRFECEKFFEISKRLGTFKKNSKQWNKKNEFNPQTSGKQDFSSLVK